MTELRNKVISTVNKLLSRFKLQLVSPPPPSKEYSLVEETVKWLDFHKANSSLHSSYYVGDINYVKDKNGKTYFQDFNTKKWYCDYDYKNPSKPVLLHMIEETTFDPTDLERKLRNDESSD